MHTFKIINLLILISNLMISNVAWSEELNFELNHFRASPVIAVQNDYVSYSIFGSWNPEYRLSRNLNLGLNLGVSVFETTGRNDYFVTNYEITAAYELESRFAGIELGYGRQDWIAHAGIGAVYSVAVFHSLITKPNSIDRIFLEYSNVAHPGLSTGEIKFGAGFSF